MRILVTGAAGFVGSHTSQLLLDEGHEVIGLDSLNDAYDPALKYWRLAQLQNNPRFAHLRGDLTRKEDVERAFSSGRIDGILHLAARAGVRQSIEDPWTYLDTNVTGTLNLLDAARRHDTRRLLMASTSSLYGDATERPVRETASTDRPLSPYAASKKAAEAMIAAYAHLYGFDATVTRYFTVYGPAGRPDMSLFRFIRWIATGAPVTVYGDGMQERDFTYVADIARANVLALEKIRGFEIVNMGNDSPVPLQRAITLIEQNLGRKANIVRRPPQASEIRASWADITKARALLGWEPQTRFEDGIRRCCEWYLANRDWVDKVDVGGV